jgi:hypothetical protein
MRMHGRGRALWGAVAASASLAAGVSGALAALGPVSVHVPQSPSVTQRVSIDFRPRAHLARGGYYYAVAVLVHYPRPLQAPYTPRCALSSDMGVTQYGFPRNGRALRLTLLAAPSAENTWCPGGRYLGAVYAVPHKPSCSSAYPCYGRGSCSPQVSFCGVVAKPGYYSYPRGLPKPVDRSTRIVGRFTLEFPEASPAAGSAGTRAMHSYTIQA